MDRTAVGAPGPTLTVTELLESAGPQGKPPSELTRSAGEDELHLKLAVVGDADKRI